MNQENKCKLQLMLPKSNVTIVLVILFLLFNISSLIAKDHGYENGNSAISITSNTGKNQASAIAKQQPTVIKGTVTNENGEPLPGVTIKIKGKARGAVTDLSGQYTIQVEPEDKVLVFSYVGYLSQEIPIDDQVQIDVSLKQDLIGLEEVVVVGYGTQKREAITSSISSVKSEDFIQGSVNNPVQLIKGKVAGLAINTTSGDPNNPDVQLMLRGVSTLQGNSQPLIVIDGIPGGSLNTVSPDDIESIDVLKDGSAAAIYGTRGTNGVILITTRKGASVSGAPTVNYHGYFSVDQISNQIEVFYAEKYREIPEITDGFFEIVDQGYSTDWWKEISRTPFSHTHNLSINGGTSSTNYIASVNYKSQEGLLINTNREELQLRLGLNHSILDNRLRFNVNLTNTVTQGQTNDENNIYFATRIANPTEPVIDSLGNYTIFAGVDNAVQMAKEFREDIKWNQTLINSKIVAEPIRGLNISLVTALQRFTHLNGWYGNRFYNTSRTGDGGRNTSLNQQKTLELIADYTKEINGHDFTILGGYSYQDFNWEGFSIRNYNYPTDAFSYNRPDLGYALKEGDASMGGYKAMSKLIAFFSRFNYSYENKYLFAASIRREGSSKFGKNNKWGLFPALSAGWRISEEGFLSTANFINDLKLRIGYGVTGTEPSNPYLSQMRFDYYTPTFYKGRWIYSVGPSMNANPNLKWETKHETNIGLDFSFLNYRLGGSVDYYTRNTKDLLYTYSVPVPPNLVSTILANVGEISNKGIEITLDAVMINTHNIKWKATGNFSYNTNELVKLSNEEYKRDFLEVGHTGAPVQKPTHLVEEGSPLGNFFGWKSTGLDSTGAWIVDGEYGELADRQILGNGIPKIFAGLSTTLSYKNLDLTVSLRGTFDYQILNQHRMLWENFIKGQQYNFPTSILDHPYGSTAWVKTAPAYVSYYIEKGDYLKIDNITLGYNFDLANNKYVKFARIYVTSLNLYTFTEYKGVDPEINFLGLSPGMDYTGGYPTTRTYTFGVKLGF